MNNNLAIAASAGTGKTYNLAVRYIRLILNGAKPDSIVALTFSRMAANEIFDRVITLLSQWINDYESYTNIAKDHQLPLCKKEDLLEALQKLILSLHRLPVGTLDSFFINILRAFSIELGLPAGFSIIDDHELHLIREKILSKILNDPDLSDKDIRNITDAYRLTTIAKDKKDVVETFFNFIDNYHESFILGNVDNWGELSGGGFPFEECEDISATVCDLLDSINSYRESGEYSPTFFNAMELFLQDSENFFGGSFGELKYLKEKVLPAYKSLLAGDCTIGGYRSPKKMLPFNMDECKKIALIVGAIINRYFEQNILMTHGIEHLIHEYEKRYSFIRKNGKLTFDDVKLLLARGGETFSSLNDGNAEKLYIDYRLDTKYKHWLLDEFQDTSRLQWKVVDNLIDEVMQDSSGEKSLFYVGDIKQAIYGWRNGDARLFNELVEKYSSNNYESPLITSPLNKSYRSASEIMDLCNHIFANDNLVKAGIDPKYLERWHWENHSTNRTDLSGYTEYFEFQKEGRSLSVERICKYIAEKIEESDALEKGLSVAVLVRSNSKGLEIYNGLKELGISSDILANIGKVDSNAEKLIHSLIIFADHPGDKFAKRHIEMSPLKEFLTDGLSYNISLMIHEKGYAETVLYWSKILNEKTELSEFSRFRLNDLMERSRRFDGLGKESSLEWQKYVSENPLPVKSKGKAVQILTVHKSKGLQYDMVFLPQLQSNRSLLKPDIDNRLMTGLEEKWAIIPPIRDIALVDKSMKNAIVEFEKDSFYESLCVLYVAMTRAKSALFLMGMEAPKKGSGSWHYETILRNLLSPMSKGKAEKPDGNIIYSDGDFDWYNKVYANNSMEKNVIKINNELKISSGLQGNATSPSGQEKGPEVFRSLFLTKGHSPADVGLAVHELFEEIYDFKDFDIDAVIKKIENSDRLNKNIAIEAIDIFKSAIKRKEISEILTIDKNEICWNEKKITTVIGGNRITGIIDRLSLFKDQLNNVSAARIIDYKTDNIRSQEDMERSKSKYSPQLKLYKEMVSKLSGLKENDIACFLIFVRTGDLVTL